MMVEGRSWKRIGLVEEEEGPTALDRISKWNFPSRVKNSTFVQVSDNYGETLVRSWSKAKEI
jgi:hypothetical protein